VGDVSATALGRVGAVESAEVAAVRRLAARHVPPSGRGEVLAALGIPGTVEDAQTGGEETE
jgi:hypothetical protein